LKPVVLALPGNEPAARRIAGAADFELGQLEVRQFPDGETYVRALSNLKDRSVILVCTLARPDEKFVPLVFACATARAHGAARVGLVAPYLAYMRQDREFKPGEAVTSRVFARALSANVDWLATVDPHLHRTLALDQIYSVASRTVHAAPLLAAWIKANVPQPIVIGPDSESEQWASTIARDAGAPYVVLQKTRRGDRDVTVSLPDMGQWRDHVPVLVDDIISSGRTMIEPTSQLLKAGMKAPICVTIHAVFAASALSELRRAGASQIVSANTIAHETNAIDVTPLLVPAIGELASP
jgi:ribose-phosphate pyrophosphokinase